jgi:hypothetical protein
MDPIHAVVGIKVEGAGDKWGAEVERDLGEDGQE